MISISEAIIAHEFALCKYSRGINIATEPKRVYIVLVCGWLSLLIVKYSCLPLAPHIL